DYVSRLIGLEGFEVTDVLEVGAQLELRVELTACVGCCPVCACVSSEVKERPVVRVRDLPVAGRVTYLCWRKRRFCCRVCRGTFTESHPAIAARQRVTVRFRGWLLERVRGGGAHAEVAREEQTTRYQVSRAFRESHGQLAARHAARCPRRLSFDEAHHRRGRELATVVSDLDRRCVIDVLDGRSRRAVERYLRSLPEQTRYGIEVVSIDPYDAYRQAIRAELPWARIVCDRFHLVRGANTALDSVRRERQRQQIHSQPKGTRRSGHTHTWQRSLYNARHRLLKANERLNHHQRSRLCTLFNEDPIIAEAWGLKEAFRSIYHATDRVHATQRLEEFLAATDRSGLPAFQSFATGIRQWREELLAYFDEPTTNGYAEGIINKVKVIKRRAYGLPTFTSFQQRILLACGEPH
ncbi:MAG TPA: ISL3 family transposase, partial [Solirubrobacteraceae bacterium]|nr:ISL3 family transposase [Solirubrobacteraceae bacterium]